MKNRPTPSLSAPEFLALAKAVDAKTSKAARGGISPGNHPVDFSVRITGTLTVREDTSKKATANVLRRSTLALVLHRAGVQREWITANLGSILTEVLALDSDAEEELLVRFPEIAAAFRHVDAIVADLPPIPVAGAVSAALTLSKAAPDAVFVPAPITADSSAVASAEDEVAA